MLKNRTRWRVLAVALGAGALLAVGGGAAHAEHLGRRVAGQLTRSARGLPPGGGPRSSTATTSAVARATGLPARA